jgi:hypothetical protein
MLSSLLNLYRCLFWLRRWPVLVVVHVHLGRMCNLLLEAVIYWCQLHAVELNCCWVEPYHYWLCAWWVCPFWIVDISSVLVGSSFSCTSNNVAVPQLQNLLLDAYILRSVTCCRTDHCVVTQCPLLGNFPGSCSTTQLCPSPMISFN